MEKARHLCLPSREHPPSHPDRRRRQDRGRRRGETGAGQQRETDNEAKDFTYTYDANGNLTKMTDNSSGAKVDTYAVTYTGLNQVKKVEEKKDGTSKTI
ncbi:hypothetical protein CHM34_04715 [Paludifilum halophilum]|uniref:Uncharacterized protein n=1 Tax=Paludifilum halophilum TaxID=1642702 RepID=A0A235B9X7_9BACL|nr:hypothetical protein CHM34_04715 [Paludifilum halophilum]